MYEYILTYRFEYDNDERYNRILADITNICENARGKHDETTSTIIFSSNISPSLLQAIIRIYFNEHAYLINRDDVICMHYTAKGVRPHQRVKMISKIRFVYNLRTGLFKAIWVPKQHTEYYKQLQ